MDTPIRIGVYFLRAYTIPRTLKIHAIAKMKGSGIEGKAASFGGNNLAGSKRTAIELTVASATMPKPNANRRRAQGERNSWTTSERAMSRAAAGRIGRM